MTEPAPPQPSESEPARAPSPAGGGPLSWVITLLVVAGLGLTLWLLPHPELPAARQDAHGGAVTITDTHAVHVRRDTPFMKRLQIVTAQIEQTEQPIVEVTGSVLAAVPATADPANAAWEFATADL